MTHIEANITALYKQFMSELEIDPVTGLLGKISNSRYANDKLRFSGFPYIGAKYDSAKRKLISNISKLLKHRAIEKSTSKP